MKGGMTCPVALPQSITLICYFSLDIWYLFFFYPFLATILEGWSFKGIPISSMLYLADARQAHILEHFFNEMKFLMIDVFRVHCIHFYTSCGISTSEAYRRVSPFKFKPPSIADSHRFLIFNLR